MENTLKIKHVLLFIFSAIVSLSFGQVSDTTEVVICDGDSYTLSTGTVVFTSGIYFDALQIGGGTAPDTSNYIDLLVASTAPITNTVVRCAPYTHVLPDGTVVNSSGVYTVPLTSSAGCEFDYITILIINEATFDTIYETICDNEFYTLPNGIPVNTPGFHTSYSLTLDGCVHTTVTHLTVNPATTTIVDTVVCSGTLFFLPSGWPAFSSGTYTSTFTNDFGCDSVIITNLTYQNAQTRTIYDTICADENYVLLDGSLTFTAGTYTFPYQTIYGCDSTVIVELFVRPVYDNTIIAGICNGLPYNLPDGTTTLVAGVYPFSYTSVYGCDSLYTVNLQVSATLYDTVAVAICAAGTYTLPDGTVVNSAGTYNSNITSLNGCDSIVTVQLSIVPPDTTIIDTVVCSGTIYILPNGFPALFAGNYLHTLQGTDGCDSTVITNLAFQGAQSSNFNAEICAGESYVMPDGSIETSSGNHTVTLQTIYGCDSNVTVNLTVHPEYMDTIRAGICGGSPFQLPGGATTTSAGTYSYPDTSINGCDSITTYILVLSAPYLDTTNVEICANEIYTLADGNTENSSGTYTVTVLASDGCDSTVTTYLNVLPLDTTVVDTVVCSGTLYFLPNGFPALFAGDYAHTLQNTQGCDSTIITHLAFQGPQTTNLNATICSNESYVMADGSTVNSSGIHSVTINTVYGCDSTINVNLFVYPAYNDTFNVVICDDEWYHLPNGDSTNVAGVYADSLSSVNGCDSLISLNLIVLNSGGVVYDVNLCNGDSFQLISGAYVSVAGVYQDTLTTANGCNGIITTNVAVFSSSIDTLYELICIGENYALPNGTVVSDTGYYTTLISSVGTCDSILTIHLAYITGGGGSSDTLNVEICNGGTYTLPDGVIVNTTGQYTSIFSTGATCDSVVVTNLVIQNSINTYIDTSICSGAYYFLPNGDSVNASGVYIDTLTATSGCDSTVMTLLLVESSETITINETLCNDQVLILPDGSFTDTTGSFSFAFVNNAGCDSIVIVHVNSLPSYNDTISQLFCSNATFNLTNGQLVNTTGVYTDTLFSSNGCDSIITYDLVFSDTINTNISAEICSNEYYTMPNGWQINLAGTYTVNLISSEGCDSIVTTTLQVNPVVVSTINPTICSGYPYVMPSGDSVYTAGVYQDTLSSANACDSIVTVNLNVLFGDTVTINEYLCNNDTLMLPDGSVTNLAGSYTFTFVSNASCDSVVIINVNSLPSYTDTLDFMLCSNASFNLPDGQILNSSGYYPYSIYSSNGCDSTIYYHLEFADTITTTVYDTICSNQYYTLPNGWDVNLEGAYEIVLSAVDGCDSVVITELTVQDIAIQYTPIDDVEMCAENIEAITIDYNGHDYLWSTGDTGTTIYPTQAGVYTVSFYLNEMNCAAIDSFEVFIDTCSACTVQAPTAFSPNGDAANNTFSIFEDCRQGFAKFELSIYNRWGNLVFYTTNPEEAWDGNYKGEKAPVATYQYVVVYTTNGSDKENMIKSNLSLIR